MLNKFFTWLLIKYMYGVKNAVKALFRSKLKTKKSKIIFSIWSLILIISAIKTDFLFLFIAIITFPLVGYVDYNRLNNKFLKKKIYQRMGFKGNFPLLARQETNKCITNYFFYANGHKLSSFKTNNDLLEHSLSTFNKKYCKIIEMKKFEDDTRFFEIITASKPLEKYFEWNLEDVKEHAIKNNILLGLSHFGEITFNFSNTPHVLIAGETGGGKGNKTRNFLLQILAQSMYNPLSVVVADFKNGLDYAKFKNIRLITEKQDLKIFLNQLIDEMNKRNKFLFKSGYENIDEYNKTSNKKLTRYYLIVDELTECIDIEGLQDKQELKLRLDIKKGLTTLARLSRAAGIHLLLTTQLPSAKIFGNQLKTNIPGRICGRLADEPSSRIVLDSGRATKLPDIKGRMIYKAGADFFEIQTPKVSTWQIVKFIKEYGSKFQLKNEIVKTVKVNDNPKLYTLEDYKEMNKTNVHKKHKNITLDKNTTDKKA